MTAASSGVALLPLYTIRPLPLAYVNRDMSDLTYLFNQGRRIDAPIFAWYVEGGVKRVLIDSGAAACHLRQYLGLNAVDIYSLEDALARLGIKPSDIDIVIQTSLMVDHCANTRKCGKARVVVQQAELEFALAPHPIVARSYVRDLFMGFDFQVVNGLCEVLPGIELVPAPGQSPGCQAVSVNTAKGRAVISGMCTVRENFEPPAGVRETMPIIPPGIHLDAVEAFNSLLRIRAIADILVPVHEPSLVNVDRIPQ